MSARLSPERRHARRQRNERGTAPRLLARGPEAALRLARAHPGATVETDGPDLAMRLRAALGPDRVSLRAAAPAFDDALEAEWGSPRRPEAPLPGGGRVLVQPTPALTAIDIDAGSVAGARDRQAQAALRTRRRWRKRRGRSGCGISPARCCSMSRACRGASASGWPGPLPAPSPPIR